MELLANTCEAQCQLYMGIPPAYIHWVYETMNATTPHQELLGKRINILQSKPGTMHTIHKQQFTN